MSSFEVPISRTVADGLDPNGPIRRLLRVTLTAEVETTAGRFTDPLAFRLDTGAGYTMMSAIRARLLGIPFPPETSRLPMTTAVGGREAVVHDGELRLRFPQLPGRVFRLYCLFVEDVPDTVPPVLGLNDTLDVFRLTLDGGYAPDAPAGHARLDAVD